MYVLVVLVAASGHPGSRGKTLRSNYEMLSSSISPLYATEALKRLYYALLETHQYLSGCGSGQWGIRHEVMAMSGVVMAIRMRVHHQRSSWCCYGVAVGENP